MTDAKTERTKVDYHTSATQTFLFNDKNSLGSKSHRLSKAENFYGLGVCCS